MINWHRRVPPPPSLATAAVFGHQSRPVATGSLKFQVGEMPRGALALWGSSPPVDYSAQVVVKVTMPGLPESTRFTGYVTEAHTEADQTMLTVAGGLALVEAKLPYLRISGVHPLEVVTALVEEEGQTLVVQGEPPPAPTEVFRVECPVSGIITDSPMTLGRIQFLPAGGTDAALELSAVVTQEISTLASCYVVANTLALAQSRGLAHIDLALDTLLLTSLYSYGADPNGLPLDYSRTRWLSRPTRLAGVLVRSLQSHRAWVRGTGPAPLDPKHAQADFGRRWPSLAHPAPENVALAMAALRRASDEQEHPVQRNQALWNALEFYAANTAVPEVLLAAERKTLKRAVKSLGLSGPKTQRVLDVLAGVNNPPLMTRIVTQAQHDGCALTGEERSLLKQLRTGRNDSSHGRSHGGPERDDLRSAISLAARLLLHHWFGASAAAAAR